MDQGSSILLKAEFRLQHISPRFWPGIFLVCTALPVYNPQVPELSAF